MTPRPDESDTRHVLYLSLAVADQPPDTFARICRRARVHNADQGISGVLLYDGEQYGQWVCGPRPAVAALMQRIAQDARHHGITVLFDGPHPAHSAPPVWRSGYAPPEALPQFAATAAAPQANVLRDFQRLIAVADLWPPVD